MGWSEQSLVEAIREGREFCLLDSLPSAMARLNHYWVEFWKTVADILPFRF